MTDPDNNIFRKIYELDPTLNWRDPKTSPLSGKTFIFNNWPIDYKDGHIDIPLEIELKGRKILLSEIMTRESFDILMNYVRDTNRSIDSIKEQTTITSSSELVMAEPKSHDGSFHNRLAWHSLRASVAAAGAKISLLSDDTPNIGHIFLANGAQETSYLTWTRDRWISGDNGNIYPSGNGDPSNERRKIQQSVPEKLNQIGAKGVSIEGFLEGGDVIQHHKSNTVFIGIKMPESGKIEDNADELKIAQDIANNLKMKLVIVPKIHDTYYHLDTFMASLPDGAIIIVPHATTDNAVNEVRRIAENDILELQNTKDNDESFNTLYRSFVNNRLNLATNIFTVNGNVFSAANLPEIRQFVEDRGYKYRSGYFEVGTGGVHCLINVKEKQKPDGKNDISMNMDDNNFSSMLESINFIKPPSISIADSNSKNNQILPHKFSKMNYSDVGSLYI